MSSTAARASLGFPPHRALALQCLGLLALALVAAGISNSLATPARRLSWVKSAGPVPPVPPVVEPSVAPPPPTQSPMVRPLKGPLLNPSAKSLPAPSPTQQAAQAEAPMARQPIREISGQEAWEAFSKGIPFLDARRSAEYAQGHVAKAFCTPVWESDLEDRLLDFKFARRPNPDAPIVIYCSGGDCRDSHLLAEKLLKEGYFNLLIYRDGFPDWVAKGHPVEKQQP